MNDVQRFSEQWYRRYDKLSTLVMNETNAMKDPAETLGKLYSEWLAMEQALNEKFYCKKGAETLEK